MKVCKHFGDCGGCSFQDIPYKEQLQRKEDRIKELISTHNITTHLKPINNYSEWFYRNKMEFTFSENGQIVCGLHSKKHKRQVVDIQECLLFSPDIDKILSAIKDFAKEKGLTTYNKYSHEGFLRHLIIRQTKMTNQTMVGIVTSGSGSLEKEELAKRLSNLKLQSQIKSIYWIKNDALGDAVTFENKELLYGDPFICEELNSLKFNIDIDSFFQVNPQGIENFYEKIRDYVDLSPQQRVLDLYCGVGCIGITLAKNAKFVWGIELKEEIVKAAWQNAKQNNIENISFLAHDTRKFLSSQGEFFKGIDLVVINPPRCGLSKKVIRGILRLNPAKIVYSSCNPNSFFTDAQGFLLDYELKFIEPFDFFAHTPHMEVLGIFERKSTA